MSDKKKKLYRIDPDTGEYIEINPVTGKDVLPDSTSEPKQQTTQKTKPIKTETTTKPEPKSQKSKKIFGVFMLIVVIFLVGGTYFGSKLPNTVQVKVVDAENLQQKSIDELQKMADEMNNSNVNYALAMKYKEKRDFENAFVYFSKAEPFLDDARFEVGYAYFTGNGTPKNMGKALIIFKELSEQDHVLANGMMGVMYHHGFVGVDKDIPLAIKYYKKAIDNHTRAIAPYLNMGLIYANGESVEKDQQKAYDYFMLAEQKGSKSAAYHLGEMYFSDKKYTDALAWYKKANSYTNHKLTPFDRHNVSQAQYQLGIMYEQGLGESRNKETAHYYYQLATQNGHKGAKEALTRIDASDE